MNNTLELKGNRFIQASKNYNRGGERNFNNQAIVTTDHLDRLISQLEEIKFFWMSEDSLFKGILISVYYNKIVAKSNRISQLFKGSDSSHSIVGAKFNENKNKHIITYFLQQNDLEKSIQLLYKTREQLLHSFSGQITAKTFKDKTVFRNIAFNNKVISKSAFRNVLSDVSYIEKFNIEQANIDYQQSIVSLFDVGVAPKDLLSQIGIDVLESRIFDENTVFLDENQVERLVATAPYLISMATVDFSTIEPERPFETNESGLITIPSPTDEPTIGVIDTLFDDIVYFREWVEYHELVDKEIPRTSKDANHGTAVTSIIVDGPTLNPNLDDGCGRFKVRHFGVAVGSRFSSFTIMQQIKSIITNNKDIKVWNISLGSNQEISDNFISAEGALLDKIQYEHDVIFVIAGTNRNESSDMIKIGSPADSINGVVVNSVSRNKEMTNYSRRGPALSFFAKPDISYYGGSKEEYINVCEPLGMSKVAGTSFAAPWISRKLAYLINVIGLRREVAKALLIDSARGWNITPTPETISIFGHGIVPIHINEILQTKDDEIKFIISDVSEKWNTYNYTFPVPLDDNQKFPFIAKATMCYFPMCSRSQGVDYTNTELNLHFGRIGNDEKIIDIKGDKQNTDDNDFYLFEDDARSAFRKWDNVKYIVENPNKKSRAKDSYHNKNWGMSIKTNNRLDPKDGMNIRFGVVVTLKEIKGKNRIDDFIQGCHLNNWIVEELNIQNRIDIHNIANEEISWE